MTKTLYSRITTWTIRILLVFIVLGGLGLMMLSSLEGTSESHRKGLEQAFSDMLGADVTIGQIEQFTILPQLKVNARNVRGTFKTSGDEFMVDDVVIAFGFLDLITARRRILDLQLQNFRFGANAKKDLKIDKAEIDKKEPAFRMNGDLTGRAYELSLPMTVVNTQPSQYSFGEQNPVKATYGALDISGTLSASRKQEDDLLKDGTISYKGKKIADWRLKRDDKGKISAIVECGGEATIPSPAANDLKALAKNDFVTLTTGCPK